MRLLISGICGFVGSTLALALREHQPGMELIGFDNFIRPGSETNRRRLQALGVRVFHADLRRPLDLAQLPKCDWIVDAAALPSVLAGTAGQTGSRQLMEHNLVGTIHLLEKCRADGAGFVLLSTSRVYSIPPLARLPVVVRDEMFVPADGASVSAEGVTESFSTAAPVSLYGASKLASETIALEYGTTFGFPVWINRCGVMAGAGQFGRADQGIFAYWINSHLRRAPLRYIGFDGLGHQVRDCLHPRDLVPLLLRQFEAGDDRTKPRIAHAAGGRASARSLRQLTRWCDERFGPHPVTSDPRERPFDVPWMVLDPALARAAWNWTPQTPTDAILEEIALHAEAHPNWLELSSPD